ncbi:hypothetical protein [Glycomyces rhizosphaerae]|uniref:Fe/B12 periplasmic-binding domain-containing protein n=1 Tax=Glycomyces rhizosphaerae TaxID=2054422 RepID=A0ABV7PRA5_9ACTN
MRLPHLKRSAVPAALAAALLAVSACGTTEEGGGDEAADVASGPVSTVDFLGRTVELDKPAERVVILEWSEVEISISLGVMPVGVADIEGYNVSTTPSPMWACAPRRRSTPSPGSTRTW